MTPEESLQVAAAHDDNYAASFNGKQDILQPFLSFA